jgi:hypothetical protein
VETAIPGPRSIVDALFKEQSDHVVVSDWLTSYLAQLGFSEMLALEKIDDLQPRVVAAIDAHIQRATSRGTNSRFTWADDNQTTLALSANLAQESDPGVEHIALKTRDGIFRALKDVSGHQFERICVYLLDVYGIDSANRGHVGMSGDQGFDFYGALLPYPRPGSERLYTLGRRFIGQAKLRWNATVDSDTVAAFGKRLADLRLGKPAPQPIPASFLGGNEPFIGLLITAGMLGPAAREEARRQVVHYIEGDQVAEDLARSPLAATWIDPATANFSSERFLESF